MNRNSNKPRNCYFSLILLFGLLYFKASGQDYNFIYPGINFQYTTPGASFVPNSNLFNYYAWSQIKETRIDSSLSTASEAIHFPIKTWRDTSTMYIALDTGLLLGPSWMGNMIKETVNGLSTFYNLDGDSIMINRLAISGQSWTLMNLDTSGTIVATVDSVAYRVVLSSWADSIKYIHLKVYDSLNVEILSHPANNIQLELGREFGWRLLFSIREFPGEVIPLSKVDNQIHPTVRDINDFDIGDEFEFDSNYNHSLYIYYYHKILDKYYNAANDTVFYARYNITNSFSASQSTASSGNDTIAYAANLNLFYTNSPEQTNTPLHSYTPTINCYTISKEPARFNNRIVFSETSGYCFIDTLINQIFFQHFEADVFGTDYSPGLGIVRNYSNQSSQFTYYEYYLNWYKKGPETWGTFRPLITDIDQQEETDEIKIFPQPAGNVLSISTKENFVSIVRFYDITGKLLQTRKVKGSRFYLDLTELPEGILLLSLEGDKTVARRRIVHIQN